MKAGQSLETEEDIKVRRVIAWLLEQGVSTSDLSLEHELTLKLGLKTYKVKGRDLARGRYDVLVQRDGKNLLLIETKAASQPVDQDSIDQALSYARLCHPTMPPCTLVTNGLDHQLVDTVTGAACDVTALSRPYRPLDASLYRQALELFLGYSPHNIAAFCSTVSRDYLMPLVGSTNSRAKYIKELYSEPLEVRKQFDSFLNSDAAVFVLRGEAGIGKSCWAVHVALQRLEAGRPTLFYRMNDLRPDLWQTLAEDLGWELSPQLGPSGAAKRLFDCITEEPLVIIVDGLDEVQTEVAREIIGRALKYQPRFGFKLVITSKPRALAQNREDPSKVPTALALASSVTVDLGEANPKEFWKIVGRYRQAYAFYGEVDPRILTDARRELFLLRVLFEVASKDGGGRVTYSTRELYEAYLARILPDGEDGNEVRQFLTRLATRLFDLSTSTVSRATLDDDSFVARDPRRIADLVARKILTEQGHGDWATEVGFYSSRVRDYVVAFKANRWEKEQPDALLRLRAEFAGSGTRRDAICLYLTLCDGAHARALLPLVYDNAAEYLSTYERLIRNHLAILRPQFSPFTDGRVGFVGDVDPEQQLVGRHGFRVIRGDERSVLLLPMVDVNPFQPNERLLEVEGGTRLRWSQSSGFFQKLEVPGEVLGHEVAPGLDRIIATGSLDETRCRALLVDRLLASVYRQVERRPHQARKWSFSSVTTAEIRELILRARARWVLEQEERDRAEQAGRPWVGEPHGTDTPDYDAMAAEARRLDQRAVEAALSGALMPFPPYCRPAGAEDRDECLMRDLSDLEALGVSEIRADEHMAFLENIDHIDKGDIADCVEPVRGCLLTLFRGFYDSMPRVFEDSFGEKAAWFDRYPGGPFRIRVHAWVELEGSGPRRPVDAHVIWRIWRGEPSEGDPVQVFVKAGKGPGIFFTGLYSDAIYEESIGLRRLRVPDRAYLRWNGERRFTATRGLVYRFIQGGMRGFFGKLAAAEGVSLDAVVGLTTSGSWLGSSFPPNGSY